MASWYDIWYDDYNQTFTWEPDSSDSYFYHYYLDDLSGYADETKIKNILDRIVACNYTGKTVYPDKDTIANAENENETEIDTPDGAKIRTTGNNEVNDNAEVNADTLIDTGAVCGISDADLTAAMHYTKKGFLIEKNALKLYNNLYNPKQDLTKSTLEPFKDF